MKINEVTELDEGPIDFAKQAWAGAKGAVQGAAAGKGVLGTVGGAVKGATGAWAKQGAANVQKDVINKVVQKAMASWGKQSQNLTAAGQQPNAENVGQWFATFSGGAPTTSPTNFNDVGIRTWLEKEIGVYLANRAAPAQPPAGEQPATAQQPQQPAMPKNPIQVKTPTGVTVVKQTNGKWLRQDTNTEISDPAEVAKLEQLASVKSQTRQMGGKAPAQAVPVQQPADTTAATPQQSAGTQQPVGTQPPAQQQPADPLPDVSNLTPEERAELRRQIQASMAE